MCSSDLGALEELRQLLAEIAIIKEGKTITLLSEQSCHAISMIFNITEDVVNSYWSKIGHVPDNISKLPTGECLSLNAVWKMMELTWKTYKKPNDEAITALRKAHEQANLKSDGVNDIRSLFDGFQEKQLSNNAATCIDLISALAIVLFFSKAARQRAKEIIDNANRISNKDERYLLIMEIEEFFSAEFMDIVSDDLESGNFAFYGTIREVLVRQIILSRRMSMNSVLSNDAIKSQVLELASKFKLVAIRWARTEKGKFEKTSGSDRKMRLVHTKSPAAFFAKHTANLCSRGNTNLWSCDTHSHILVFSDESPFLQGMASIYIEDTFIEGKGKKVLIIRNLSIISSTRDLGLYDSYSVMDSFFAMASLIAEHNACNICAFIDQSSQHYCTNQDDIWKAIKKKYSRIMDVGSKHRHEITFSPYKDDDNEKVRIFALPSSAT